MINTYQQNPTSVIVSDRFLTHVTRKSSYSIGARFPGLVLVETDHTDNLRHYLDFADFISRFYEKIKGIMDETQSLRDTKLMMT